jgi:hypothetical protein
VVEVPGRVAEVLQVRAPGHVERAPQRLARDRDEQPAPRHAGHLLDRVHGVGHVLEHLDRAGHVELAVSERQVLGLHDAVLEVGRAALGLLGLERRVLEVDADDAPLAELLRPPVSEHPLAAPDVEERARLSSAEQLLERALEAGHQAADDRVRRAVLVVGVAGDGPLGVDRDGGRAHALTASRSSVRWPACAPVVRGNPVSRAPGS